MQTFEFKKLPLFAAISLGIFLIGGLLGGSVYFLEDLLFMSDWQMILMAMAFLVVSLTMIATVKKVFGKCHRLSFTPQALWIEINGIMVDQILYQEITMLKYLKGAGGGADMLQIYAAGKKVLNLNTTFDKISVLDLLSTIQKHASFRTENEQLGGDYTPYSIEYINTVDRSKNMVHMTSNGDTVVPNGGVEDTRKKIARNKNWVKWSLIIGFILLIGILILPFFINPKAFYDTEDGQVFFGKTPLPSIDYDTFETLSSDMAKDYQHIYYRGELVDFVDYDTFEFIDGYFYRDKNGLYYEERPLYSKYSFQPMAGDFDAETFQSVENSFFYKDKNTLYEIDHFSGSDYVKLLSIAEVDVATFTGYDTIWHTDKNTVYFDHRDEIEVTSLDRETFEYIDMKVVKDKNHVYYNKRDLSSDGKSATDNLEYGILEGAHAPTFIKIGDKEYMDKNTTWTIDEI